MQKHTQQLLRNVAIIAHVDHGKTTLVDSMLKQTRTFAAHQKENQQTTIMDSNDLERERGVTILAKNTAVFWEEYKINILDTPGHADFSGEVERVLNMADGCVLLVDAAEGVLSQTRFVLALALQLGLIPIVIINKVDRKDQRVVEVRNEIDDLFLELATNESQLNFPLLYARGFEGIAGFDIEEQADHSLKITDSTDLTPVFKTIVETVPFPKGDLDGPLQLQITNVDYDDYQGKYAIGRIVRGSIKRNQQIALLRSETESSTEKVKGLFTYYGLDRIEIEEASVGEIVAITGLNDPHIGNTLTDVSAKDLLPALNISEPTVKVQLSVNTSPFAGREGQFSTSRQLRERLKKELETNVGLRVTDGTTGERVTLIGRGELHLSILVETMRREGYEFSLSRPEVVIRITDGQQEEPWEYVTIDAPETRTGVITSNLAQRRGELISMQTTQSGTRFTYEISTSNIIGLRNELMTSTSGEAVLNSSFLEYRPLSARIEANRGGAIISHEIGTATAYSIEKAQDRGMLIVNPGEEVYGGQVVGIHKRAEDIVMNVSKGKKLTNMRAASADATVVLAPAWKPSLEQFLTLIADDEILEVTPLNMRLRKIDLIRK
ncbi:MAG: translational GTPase TypA [Candidatus Pacebacteria bacterium]|nr:translational GTPase TypA [Candidatus Paceibacterota bacterium]